MKIAIAAEPFLPIPPKKYGGVERVIYYLIKGLQQNGHEVVLLAPGDSKVDCELIPICEKHFFFGKTRKEQDKLVEKNKIIRERTINLLRGILHRVDIIHSHGLNLSEFSDFPNVTTLHGMFTLKQMEYFKERKNLNYISISLNQRKSFPQLNYVGNVYNGEDPEEYPFIKKPKKYLCFIGRFDREKNPLDAIELAIHLGMKIKLAGKIDFQGRDYFNKAIKPYFSHPLVEYLGELGMEDKIKLIGNAACNLHPINFREPFGLTVIESAYCGTPTLATRRGSMSEIIENNRTGVLVDDFAEGYHKLEECFKMDRNYISTRARALFNYKRMAKDYETVYKEVIRKFVYHKKGNGEKRVIAQKTNLPRDKFLSSIEAFWNTKHWM
jgi:glycosyltransferase involved in cell wall biosynthesis